MTTTMSRDFAAEKADVIRELATKNADRDRFAATGDANAFERASREIAALEQRQRNIESSVRGARAIAESEAAALDARDRKTAAATAHAALDDLTRLAGELEHLEGSFLRKIEEIRFLENRIPGAIARFATRETEGIITQLSLIVGRLPIEDGFAQYNLVGLGERTAKVVARSRAIVDRIVALPPGEKK